MFTVLNFGQLMDHTKLHAPEPYGSRALVKGVLCGALGNLFFADFKR